jgi:hypothetical protein
MQNHTYRVQTKLSRHIGGWRGCQPRERPPVGVPANRNSCYVATIWFAPNGPGAYQIVALIFLKILYCRLL